MVVTVSLNSGYVMPTLGFGTFSSVLIAEDELVQIFLNGIEIGYRHIDTASIYKSEKAVGKAVSKAVEQKIVSSREELFITSKLWCDDANGDLVLPALKKSLENLGLDYLDLFLIHWPVRLRKKEAGVPKFTFKEEDILPFDMRSTWEVMEECKRLGLVHSIGVSNFSSKKLLDLLDFATIPPSVNQVEMNPLWNQKILRGFCKEKGIQITAYSPLGANGDVRMGGTMDILDSPTLKEIAQAKQKTTPQICLRWLHDKGVTFVVKSYNKDRMKENHQIFDWELSVEEKDKIDNIPQKKNFLGNEFVCPNGPYKSVDELWDGEL
ncbi:putative NAD(P)H-dependent oxidoreductase 2 [Zostera marina]|uniref:Putative NAD(P)H-dependent oxidoreductase 2 n=1 Tax=Zostera marina TaxID=29655 RepID=A0A0K9PJK0_ZOSMR|nr:putative NAD(P)H-dependent oxidoreductase 2 [Zostera marina]